MVDRISAWSVENRLKIIVYSNHYIREIIQRNVNNFLKLFHEVLDKPEVKNLAIFADILGPLIEGSRIAQLKACTGSDKIQLAFCGENSSGKTAFLHTFLGIGKILPSGDGPVTARITKLTFSLPEQASIRLYHSLLDQKQIEEVNISHFFAREKPDWMGVGRVLEQFTRRPTNIDDRSVEFDQWARCLLEIRIPSPILALGIDVYDTPGFLFDDAPVLKEILHELVQLVHPTIVFLYANPSTDDGTRGCFLAMKAALRDLEETSIFFLNSKADVHRMPKFRKDMSREEFIAMLNEEQAQRYTLLLKAPFLCNANLIGFPKSVNQCSYFDMCSVNSQIIKPHGSMINEMAIERIIQFVANDDMKVTTRVCRLILPIIDAFFQFYNLTHNRTVEQLLQLKYDGMKWSAEYFKIYKHQTERFLIRLFEKLDSRLNTEEHVIREILMGKGKLQRYSNNYLSSAINLQVIRPVIRETIKESVNSILELIRSNTALTNEYIRNEILTRALSKQELSDFACMLLDNRADGNVIAPSILYMINTFAIPTITCAKSLVTKTDEICALLCDTSEDQSTEGGRLGASKSSDLVQRYICSIKKTLEEQKDTMHQAVTLAGQHEQAMLESLVTRSYSDASPQLLREQQVLHRIEGCNPQFIVIECELRAAQDMARFPGQTPEIRSDRNQHNFFSISMVDWGDDKNLMVKKLTQPIVDQPYITYYEAHYHLQVAKLQGPSLNNLRYLYHHRLDHGSSELWMIFPPTNLTLQQFLNDDQTTILVGQVLQWMIYITEALKILHDNEFVHGNVTLGNIGLNELGKAYLMDFDEWNEDGYYRSYHYQTFNAHRVNDDIKALGRVGQVLIEVVKGNEENSLAIFAYKELMLQCIRASDEKPIEADFVKTCLTSLSDKI